MLKFTMEVMVGKHKLNITEECNDTKDLFKKAGFYGTIPSKCGNCDGDDLMLNHRQPQGKYDYFSVDCKECGHRLNYGIHNNDEETLFAKLNDGWEPPYEGDEEEGDSKKSSKKSGGKSALEKAKAAKKKAQAEEEEDESENSSEEEEQEEKETKSSKKTSSKKSASSSKRSDILAKFGKKRASK